MNKKLIPLVLIPLILFGYFSISSPMPDVQSDSNPISHEKWTALLKKHVNAKGDVDYKGFKNDSKAFDEYLKLLSTNHPNKLNWSEEERLVYWINAYNAFTVKLIIDNYPLKSIKDITAVNIPLVKSPWDIKFIEIEGEKYDLNNIEHQILRKKFSEPRIHFAVNCASVSCPILRNEAYEAERVEEQLQEQAELFINDAKRNKIASNEVEISKIFSWFSGDFEQNGTVIDFINRYSKTKIEDEAKVKYLDYNWNLNE
ncbi:DUF547 domain-containing protein [Sediminitomix flava]|nr:DUF547 domain-containing protein [Sediminitomix flava]